MGDPIDDDAIAYVKRPTLALFSLDSESQPSRPHTYPRLPYMKVCWECYLGARIDYATQLGCYMPQAH